jgi:hypothetical protein
LLVLLKKPSPTAARVKVKNAEDNDFVFIDNCCPLPKPAQRILSLNLKSDHRIAAIAPPLLL